MSSLVVFAFSDEGGADRIIPDVQPLQKQGLITLLDAAIVIRKHDGKLKIKHVSRLVGSGVLGGAFWGMLIGLIFFMPWIGMATGAVTGAVAGKLSDYGISDSFVKEVGTTIRPGNSALFLMVDSMTDERVIEVLSKHKATLLRTNLSKEDEAKLSEAFGVVEMEI